MPRKKKSTQTTVPGTNGDRIAAIDKLGEAYAEADTAVADASAEREGFKLKLEAAMKEHGRKEYKLLDLAPPLVVKLEDRGQKLAVKKLKQPPDDSLLD
jgi:hypothetical protein